MLHGREVYSRSQDERKGWLIALPIDGFLDVEEFFVRPTYRENGIGRRLLRMLRELSLSLNLPSRLWIDWADWTPENETAVRWLADALSLNIYSSPVRWAAAVAFPDSAQTQMPSLSAVMPPAAMPRPVAPLMHHHGCLGKCSAPNDSDLT